MKALRVSLMVCMLLYFAVSCIAFSVAAAYVFLSIFVSSGMARAHFLLLFCTTEAGIAILFGLAACATMMGWRTRNRWGIAGSLLGICVPLLVLHWGVSVFSHYLVACLWPSWLFGVIGLILFPKAGTPHSLSHDLRMTLHAAQERRRSESPNR